MSVVFWLTGLSGAGKTTIAQALFERLKLEQIFSLLLDGDEIRKGLCADLGFSKHDRGESVRRIGEVAKILVENDIVAIVACISPYAEDRKQVKSRFKSGQFMEVFVDCPLEECARRDPKGLYARANHGGSLTGIDSPYEAPQTPDLHLFTNTITVAQAVESILIQGSILKFKGATHDRSDLTRAQTTFKIPANHID